MRAILLALFLTACASTGSQEIAPGNWPMPAVSRVTVFKCAFVRLPCDARPTD